MTQRSKTALYPGSFRPFTVGHKSIADRTLAICDRLVIAVGFNPDKESGDTDRLVAGIKGYLPTTLAWKWPRMPD